MTTPVSDLVTIPATTSSKKVVANFYLYILLATIQENVAFKRISLWFSPVTFRNYSLVVTVVTSRIALLHLKGAFLVDSTKMRTGIKLLETNILNQVQSGVPSSQKETPLSSPYPSNCAFLLTRKSHPTNLVPFTLSTPKVGAGRGGTG